MKNLLAAVSLGLLAMGTAHGSTTKTFNGDALQLLTAVHNNCPVEFIQAMSGAQIVGKATFQSDRSGVEIYTIETRAGYSPLTEPYAVATLKIERTIVEEDGPIAQDRPSQWNVSCVLTRHD